jgi:hypothetical protein
MGVIDDKLLKGLEKAGETVLKHSEGWGIGQKVVAFLVCLLAAAALVSGRDSLRVAGGVTIALFGIAFLTFRRRIVECETLLLKDSSGKPRIALSAEHGIILFDDNADPRIVANVFNGQPVIHMTSDKESVLIGVLENGAIVRLGNTDMAGAIASMRRGQVDLGFPDGARLWLTAQENDAKVVLNRADVGLVASISVSDYVGARFGNLDGASVSVTAASDGNLAVSLESEEGEAPVILGSSGTRGHLSFFGENGRLLARYPDDELITEDTRAESVG